MSKTFNSTGNQKHNNFFCQMYQILAIGQLANGHCDCTKLHDGGTMTQIPKDLYSYGKL